MRHPYLYGPLLPIAALRQIHNSRLSYPSRVPDNVLSPGLRPFMRLTAPQSHSLNDRLKSTHNGPSQVQRVCKVLDIGIQT
jgi:hypothetical protein